MANFCGKCGKPLQDGEVCSCSQGSVGGQATTVNQVQPQQPTSPVQPVQQAGYTQPTQSNQPGYGQPVQGNQPGYGQPVQGNQPVYGQQVQGNQPGYNQPLQGNQPGYGQPMGNQPGYGQPMQGGYPNGQPGQPSQPNQVSQKASQAADAAGNYLKKAWNLILGIWKQPATNLKDATQEKNFSEMLGFIGTEAILMIILSCVLLKNVFGAFFMAFGGYSSLYSDLDVKPPYIQMIISTIIFAAGGACIFAAALNIIAKQYAKAQISFKRAICVYAMKSAAMLPFFVVAIVTSFFNMFITMLIVLIGGILGVLYMHKAVQDVTIQDENKREYTTFLTVAIHIILSGLLMYILSKIIF